MNSQHLNLQKNTQQYLFCERRLCDHQSTISPLPTDHVSLLHRFGELRQREDLHVLPRRTRTGHLCARRVVHLQSAVTAGGSRRSGLPEQETEHAHRDSAQENAD